MAFNEVKECCKGHEDLADKLHGENLSYVAKRHASRVMCDAYGRGIIRGQVENTNLRANGRTNDVTAAECFCTCATATFFGREYVDEVERQTKTLKDAKRVIFGEIDARNPRRRKVTFRNVSELYGQRPVELLYLSPYEFVTYWEPQLLKYPRHEYDRGPEFHATLTDKGKRLLQEQRELRARGDTSAFCDLIPGEDYVVKEATLGEGWLPYPDVPSTQHFRHTWVLVRRRRPVAPSFHGSPIPKHRVGEGERAASIVMAYFHPWTTRNSDDACAHAPHVSQLRGGHDSWKDALAGWLDGGIISFESKRYVSNFLSVYRVRPCDDDDDDENSDNLASDEELEISHAGLAEALQTRIDGRQNEEDDNVGPPCWIAKGQLRIGHGVGADNVGCRF